MSDRVRQAVTVAALDGGELPPGVEGLLRRYADGELSWDGYMAGVREAARAAAGGDT